jgi:tetratricopeptide (TPR) repeat protein
LNPNLLFKIFDMKNIWKIALAGVVLLCVVATMACVTTKKKGEETSKTKKFYHSFTNKYNYWFNADELFRLTTIKLEEQYKDNYSQILEVYPYAAADPSSVRTDLDNVILKSAKGISLHRPGHWTDDNYGLMGKAQFLKRDFETAEATYKFIREEQDPRRVSKSKLKSSKSSKKKVAEKKKTAKKKKAEAKKKKAAAAKKKKAAAKKKKKSGGKSKTDPKATEKTTTAPLPKNSEELTLTGNPYDQPFGQTHDFPTSMVWYGRTLTERNKYDEAEFLFRELWEDRSFPKKAQDDLATAEAYLFIKQKKYDKAIAPLSKAIELTESKKLRARLSFILAQLYERSGQYEAAFAAYDRVLKNSPKYEMEFNARLQQTTAGWTNGKISSDAAIKTCERMLNDDKNLEYRDQIYAAMADISLHDSKKKEGIEYLRKSLAFNKNNTTQRAETYLRLADLYFEDEQFVLAKAYYDSTLTVLPVDDERHKRATDYANNLKDIARLIQTIAANDSIVRIFHMSDAERKDLAKNIKKQRDAAEAEAIKNSVASATQSGPAKAPTPTAGSKPSNFYFYNETFLKKGRKDFSRNWGDRKLDDNWRRSNRIIAGGGDELAGGDSTRTNAAADAALNDIFSNIPKSEAELTVIHVATYEAMYQLGTLFRDRLQNNRRCTGTLEDLQVRYPDTARYEKETWYYCYLAFTDLSNQERAKYYFDKLVEKYPKSAYARTLTDPNFLNATKERERELNKYYEDTYALFKKGNYKEANDRCTESSQKFGSQNALVAKFSLLSAMCAGSLNGNDAYCSALGDVIKRYPESPEATRAKEIARLLACKGFEVDDKKKNADTAIDEGFTREDDKLHYFIVALSGDNVKLDEVKAAVSDYNTEFHKAEQLRISNIFLGTDTNTPIVVIRKFDTKEQAMRYYNEVKNQKGFLGETAKKTYNKEMFAVTQENYRRILKNKTLDRYREFFEENYLKK